MPAGIQVFNADGSLQFDISNRLFRTISFNTTSGSAGSVTVSGASALGTLRAQAFLTDTTDDAAPPAVTVSGDTISWGAGAASRILGMIY